MLSPLRGDPRIAPIGLQQEVVQKTDAYKTAADALKTRIYYVSQVVIFLIALTGLTLGLTVGYNKEEGMMTFSWYSYLTSPKGISDQSPKLGFYRI